jgi:hypothetical protein
MSTIGTVGKALRSGAGRTLGFFAPGRAHFVDEEAEQAFHRMVAEREVEQRPASDPRRT